MNLVVLLLIWVFSLFLLVNLVKALIVLFIFLKNQLFVSLILCIFLLVSFSLISALFSLCCFLFWFILLFLRAWDAFLVYLLEITLIFHSIGGLSQGPALARQVLYNLSHSTSLFMWFIFSIWSCFMLLPSQTTIQLPVFPLISGWQE
jgi:hypothetical protein